MDSHDISLAYDTLPLIFPSKSFWMEILNKNLKYFFQQKALKNESEQTLYYKINSVVSQIFNS